MESQPQSADFRINPENFHPCKHCWTYSGCKTFCLRLLWDLSDVSSNVGGCDTGFSGYNKPKHK